VGIDWGDVRIDVAIRSDWWCFVAEPRFVDPDVVRWAYPVGRNTTFIPGTREVTRVRVVDKRIVNEGIGRGEIERVSKRAVPVHRVVGEVHGGPRDAVLAGDEVRVFRPEVREAAPGSAPPRGRRPAEPPGQSKQAPAGPVPDQDAEKRWDRGWNDDWRQLQRVQKEDEKKAPAPAEKPARTLQDRHREENYQAAENAHKEEQAAQERARRLAERARADEKKARPKKEETPKPKKR